MQAGSDTLAAIANHWLARFEHALGSVDAAALAALFRADGHWRDVLAFSGRIRTVSAAPAIAAALGLEAPLARASGFRTDPERTAPRHATRAGAKCIEAIFRFETAAGRGSGVLRFLADTDDNDPPRAWTLLTTLEELRGHEERIGSRRPTGQSYSRDFSGPNWLDLREAAAAYADRDPQVLIVGGGQAGLSIGARLVEPREVRLVLRIGDVLLCEELARALVVRLGGPQLGSRLLQVRLRERHLVAASTCTGAMKRVAAHAPASASTTAAMR